MDRLKWFLAATSASLLAILYTGSARAGGDDLYGDTQGHPPQLIGIARDVATFKPIPDMRVFATFKNQKFTTLTDPEGRFRIEGFVAGFDADAVQIVCEKTGYKTINVLRRKISTDPAAPVEIECLSQPG